MAIQLPDFLKSGKSRIFIVVGAMAGIGFAIFIAAQFFGGKGNAVGASQVAGAPGGLETVPGGKMTPEFYRAVVQANAQAAQQAKISGGSAVPTLLNVPGEQTGFPQSQGESCTTVCSDEAINVANEINNLARAGKLSKSDADKLLELTKKNVTEEEFAAELNALVRNGRLTPDQARQLLDHYKKQRQNQLVKDSAAAMDGLIKSGQLPLTIANSLLALQKSGISCADYDAELKRLNATGKISTEVADQLSKQRQEQCAKMGEVIAAPAAKSSNVAHAIAENVETEFNAIVDKLPPEVASQLKALAASNVSPEQYKNVVEQLVREGKISAAEGKRLIDGYQKLSDFKNTMKRLEDLKNKKASPAEYAEELKKAVKAGLLTPQQAAALLKEYSGAPVSTIGPPPAAGVAGGTDFARLQEHLKAEEGAPTGLSEAEIQQFQAAEQEQQSALAEERNRRLAEMATAMSGQAQQLIAAWQPVMMVHQEGSFGEEGAGEEGAEGRGANGKEGSSAGPGVAGVSAAPLIKAGTILFAVLDTAVNSDYPDSPVMATVVQGPFKGAKLLGKLSMASGKDRVALNFNLMNMDAWMNAQSVNAFAMDPDTARTVLASHVDNHYLKRYGALFASSFVSGYADAIMQSGSVQTTGVFGTTSTTSPLSPANKIAVGIGGIGKALSAAVSKYVDTPTTVIVNSGVGLGILFMSDVTKDAPPPAGAGPEAGLLGASPAAAAVVKAANKGSAGATPSPSGGLPTAPTNLLKGAAGMLNAIKQPAAGTSSSAATYKVSS